MSVALDIGAKELEWSYEDPEEVNDELRGPPFTKIIKCATVATGAEEPDCAEAQSERNKLIAKAVGARSPVYTPVTSDPISFDSVIGKYRENCKNFLRQAFLRQSYVYKSIYGHEPSVPETETSSFPAGSFCPAPEGLMLHEDLIARNLKNALKQLEKGKVHVCVVHHHTGRDTAALRDECKKLTAVDNFIEVNEDEDDDFFKLNTLKEVNHQDSDIVLFFKGRILYGFFDVCERLTLWDTLKKNGNKVLLVICTPQWDYEYVWGKVSLMTQVARLTDAPVTMPPELAKVLYDAAANTESFPRLTPSQLTISRMWEPPHGFGARYKIFSHEGGQTWELGAPFFSKKGDAVETFSAATLGLEIGPDEKENFETPFSDSPGPNENTAYEKAFAVCEAYAKTTNNLGEGYVTEHLWVFLGEPPVDVNDLFINNGFKAMPESSTAGYEKDGLRVSLMDLDAFAYQDVPEKKLNGIRSVHVLRDIYGEKTVLPEHLMQVLGGVHFMCSHAKLPVEERSFSMHVYQAPPELGRRSNAEINYLQKNCFDATVDAGGFKTIYQPETAGGDESLELSAAQLRLRGANARAHHEIKDVETFVDYMVAFEKEHCWELFNGMRELLTEGADDDKIFEFLVKTLAPFDGGAAGAGEMGDAPGGPEGGAEGGSAEGDSAEKKLNLFRPHLPKPKTEGGDAGETSPAKKHGFVVGVTEKCLKELSANYGLSEDNNTKWLKLLHRCGMFKLTLLTCLKDNDRLQKLLGESELSFDPARPPGAQGYVRLDNGEDFYAEDFVTGQPKSELLQSVGLEIFGRINDKFRANDPAEDFLTWYGLLESELVGVPIGSWGKRSWCVVVDDVRALCSYFQGFMGLGEKNFKAVGTSSTGTEEAAGAKKEWRPRFFNHAYVDADGLLANALEGALESKAETPSDAADASTGGSTGGSADVLKEAEALLQKCKLGKEVTKKELEEKITSLNS